MTKHISDTNSFETTRFYPVVIRGSKQAECPAPTNESSYSNILAGPCYENRSLIINKSFLTNTSPLEQKIEVTDKHLADILWIWEGEDGQWEDNMPFILRFEDIDVVLSPKRNGQIVLWSGSVKTEYPVFLTSNKTTAGRAINQEFCLQWLTQNRLTSLIGKKIAAFELLRCATGDIVLLTFNNASSLIVRNQNGYLGIDILKKAC